MTRRRHAVHRQTEKRAGSGGATGSECRLCAPEAAGESGTERCGRRRCVCVRGSLNPGEWEKIKIKKKIKKSGSGPFVNLFSSFQFGTFWITPSLLFSPNLLSLFLRNKMTGPVFKRSRNGPEKKQKVSYVPL